MFRFASLDLGSDYRSYALARVLQGVGLGFFFVPVTRLAYSYIPLNKNNKASSITNLFRNLGGSFGVAFVTTMLERRTQFHHSILAQHLTPENPVFQQSLESLTQQLTAAGSSGPDAAQKAYAVVSGIANPQAAFLGPLDCFPVLGWIGLQTLLVVDLMAGSVSAAAGPQASSSFDPASITPARPVNPAANSTTPTSTAGQKQKPFLVSVPTGPVSDKPIDLSLEDAITRGLRFNLGVIENQVSLRQAQAARLRALSAMGPDVSALLRQKLDDPNRVSIGLWPPALPVSAL